MNSVTINFKATALDSETLHRKAPSIFATGPMAGVSQRYTFVPTARIISGLRDENWVPVDVEEQRIRTETRRGFQKHLLRFRRAEQMETLDEWNVELVLINSHDAGCAYQLHAGIYRRICSNGLVMGEETFPAMRFRHAGLDPDSVVKASSRLVQFIPRVGEKIGRFRAFQVEARESAAFVRRAVEARYGALELAPVEAGMLLQARRPEDEGTDLWRVMNRVQENLIRGGLSDGHRDRRGRLRSVRPLRGIDSQITLNKEIWELADRLVSGASLANELAFPG